MRNGRAQTEQGPRSQGVRSSIHEIGHIAHFIVKVGDKYFEAGGIFAEGKKDLQYNSRRRYYTQCIKRISRNYLQKLVDADVWNPYFHREEYAEELAEMIRSAVASLEIN